MTCHILDYGKAFINIIYPMRCEVCGKALDEKNKTVLCQDCYGKIIFAPPTQIVKSNNLKIWAVCLYEGVIKECVHLLKYKGRLSLAGPMSELLINFATYYLKPSQYDMIVPVPLHNCRLREREFNQSEILAKSVAKAFGRPVSSNVIKRIKATLSQAGLSKTKWLENLRGAFKVADRLKVQDKNLLLIDDVLTTGSTVSECAKVLFEAGAKSQDVLVLARGM